MTIANPAQIKDAITAGATFSAGLLVVSGVAKYPKLDNSDPAHPFWKLDDVSGTPLLNRAHFNRIANNIVLTDPGDYQYCLADGNGNPIGQLAVVTVTIDDTPEPRAMVIDPP